MCPLLGHPFCAVMSEGNSKESAQVMRGFRTEVTLVPQAKHKKVANQVSGDDLASVEERTQEICRERNAFRVDQFHRQGNMDAHYFGTVLEHVRDSVELDGFCDFVSTGGSFAGCSLFHAI